MAKFQISAPDGQNYEVEAPDDASEADVMAYVQQSAGQPQAAPAQAQPHGEPDSMLTRRVRGLVQTTVVPAAQLMSKGMAMYGEQVRPLLPKVGEYLESLPGQVDAFADDLRKDAAAGAPEGFDYASMEGQVMGTMPAGGLRVLKGAAMLPNLVNRAASGAVQGAQLSPTNEAGVSENAAVGAGVNVVVPPFLRAISRVISPVANKAANLLTKEGVKLTPGQILGGRAKAFEDKLTSVPGLGDVVSSAQRRSFESFNRAVIQRALDPVGEKLPANLKGREAVAYAEAKLGDKYDALLPQLKGDADAPFVQQMMGLQNVSKGLPPEQQAVFDRVMRDEVLGKFTPNGKMTGDTMKMVQRRVAQFVNAARQSKNPYDGDLAQGLKQLNVYLRDLVKRSNPSKAVELEKIDKAYAAFKRVQHAAAKTTSQDGIFTPDAYNAAVKALDKSKDKAAFARGGALDQEFSEAARGAMGSRVPDSGSAGRWLVGAGISGGAAAVSPPVLGGMALAATPYLPGGRQVAEWLLMRRPPGFNALARGIDTSAPALAPAALQGANALLNSRE